MENTRNNTLPSDEELNYNFEEHLNYHPSYSYAAGQPNQPFSVAYPYVLPYFYTDDFPRQFNFRRYDEFDDNVTYPINFGANNSFFSDGRDLPLHDIPTLRFFYNFGLFAMNSLIYPSNNSNDIIGLLRTSLYNFHLQLPGDELSREYERVLNLNGDFPTAPYAENISVPTGDANENGQKSDDSPPTKNETGETYQNKPSGKKPSYKGNPFSRGYRRHDRYNKN